jgi:hypothetical protein
LNDDCHPVQEVRTQAAATARPDRNQTTILSRTHVHRNGATAQGYKGSNLPGAHAGGSCRWMRRPERLLARTL